MINLGEFEFVSFVKHTHMINQKLFRKSKEDKIIFLILVRHNGSLRLISYSIKSAFVHESVTTTRDGENLLDSIHLFSGLLTKPS